MRKSYTYQKKHYKNYYQNLYKSVLLFKIKNIIQNKGKFLKIEQLFFKQFIILNYNFLLKKKFMNKLFRFYFYIYTIKPILTCVVRDVGRRKNVIIPLPLAKQKSYLKAFKLIKDIFNIKKNLKFEFLKEFLEISDDFLLNKSVSYNLIQKIYVNGLKNKSNSHYR